MKKNNKKRFNYLFTRVMRVVLVIGVFFFGVGINSQLSNTQSVNMTTTKAQKDYVYLSDLDYITANNWSYNGWSGHSIQKDKNPEGGQIKLKIDGEAKTFLKGIGVHAKGQVTYDISELSNKYTKFIAKVGVDASRTATSNLHFQISVSSDGENWTLLQKTSNITYASNAVDVNLDITGQKYLRIYVDPNGSNSADHGVIGDAKLTIADYVEAPYVEYDKLKDLDYYDDILNTHDVEYNYKNNYRLILERELVRKLGYEQLNLYANFDEDTRETLDWIVSDDRVIEEIIEVSEIDVPRFLEALVPIYIEYKDALKEDDGYVYEKMMIGLAAAYSSQRIAGPTTMGHQIPTYDPLERFTIMKKLFDEKLFMVQSGGKFVEHDWFRSYHVELMRYVMQDSTRNEEIEWLNYYSHYKNSLSHYLVPYITPNYGQAKFYDSANKELYSQKYLLDKFNIPVGEDKIVRYWMVMEGGNVCWGQSRFGASLFRVNGIPSTGVYQPYHEPYIIYTQDADGNGIWQHRYGGNWGASGSSWYGGNNYRYLFNWGNKYFADAVVRNNKNANNDGYLILAQANLNRYEEFKPSIYYNLLANSYTDPAKKIEAYNKALESIEINLDTFDNMINLYKSMGDSVTSEDWYKLSLKIIDAYTYYPQAMYDLIKVIRPYLTETTHRLDIDMKEKAALYDAFYVTSEESLQPTEINSIARGLLRYAQPEFASFSYDGANAGKIVTNAIYDNYDFRLSYSLDGENTWSEWLDNDHSHSIQLSDDEIKKITVDDGIKIRMEGFSTIYSIAFTKSTMPSLHANDLENRVIGVTQTMEWSNNPDGPWTKYADKSPDNTGDKTLYVRVADSGTAMHSDYETYKFTEDNQPDTRQYIKVAQLSIEDYSTQSKDTGRPYYAPNIIDANVNTLWHTDFALNVLQQEQKPFVTVKLEVPKFISAVEFIQTKYKTNDPDDIKNMRVYVSEDNENWVLAGSIENCAKDNKLKTIDFKKSVYGQYVKFEMDTYNMFASLAMVNIYKDITKQKEVVPTAAIGYDTDINVSTNKNVLARLVSPSEPITITNNGGSDTYVFEENGEFTFEFENANGVKGSATAKVDCIDKKAPTGTISYNITSPTNKVVVATLKPSEDVIVTNNGDYRIDEDDNIIDKEGNILDGYQVDDKGNITDKNGNFVANMNTFTYEFYNNGEFTFEFEDLAGNEGTATAKVNWIDYDAPIATLYYDKVGKTDQNVNVRVEFNEEAYVTNNNKKTTYTFTKNGEFTFEYRDVAGNKGSITAKVDWIEKKPTTSDDSVNTNKPQTSDKTGNSSSNSTQKKTGNKKVTSNTKNKKQQNKNTDSKNEGNEISDETSQNDETSKNNVIKYKVENISVSILGIDNTEKMSLKVDNKKLNSSLKRKFGSNSEYFELYLEDADYEKVSLDSSKIKIVIDLDKDKEFLGLYQVGSNMKAKALDYKLLDNNKIEVETENLGEYIISYKDEKANTTKEVKKAEKNDSKILWFALGGLVLISSVITIIIKRKRAKRRLF